MTHTYSDEYTQQRNRKVHHGWVQQHLQDGYQRQCDEKVPVYTIFCDMFLSDGDDEVVVNVGD